MRATGKERINMAIDFKDMSKRIRRFRLDKNMSQKELGEIVHITGRYVSYIESGTKAPSLELLVLIANALDVSADDLLMNNLKHSCSHCCTEIHTLLLDCNKDEKAILTKTVKFLRTTLAEHGV